MPTPDGLPVSSLHGEFKQPNAAGTPKQGTVTFTPTPSPIAFPDQNVLILGTETATIDANGEFTIQLVSTDTANANPSGWTYRVTEKIIGEVPRQYNILLPYSVGTVELSDITPVDAAPTYLPVIGPQGPPGVIQTVNGKTGISITLDSTDVGAIPMTQKGAASGVATLDSGSKLTASQYDWDATTPTAIATAGAVGTSTKPARSDHTHAGVALTGAQTVAGVKTFSSSPVVPTPSSATDAVNKSYVDGAGTFTGAKTYSLSTTGDLAVGVILTGDTNRRYQVLGDGSISWGPGNAALDTTISRTGVSELTFSGQLRLTGTNDASLSSTNHPLQIGATAGNNIRIDNNEIIAVNNGAANTLDIQADGGNLRLFNTTAAQLVINGTEAITSASAATVGLGQRVTADTQDRFQRLADGTLKWGPGNATQDTTLFREAAGTLSTTATGIRSYRAASSDFSFSTRVAGDAASRWYVEAGGTLNWGDGTNPADAFLSRLGANVLSMANTRLSINRSASTTPALSLLVGGDTTDRLAIQAGGKMSWSAGSGSADTVLYRNATGELKTDTKFTVGTDLTVVGSNLILAGGTYRNKAAAATVTVANTVTETVLSSLTIPAGEPAFATYRMRAWGTISNGATTPNHSWKLRYGGVSGALMATAIFSFAFGSSGTRTWRMEADVVILTTGSSGTSLGQIYGTTNLNTNSNTNNTAAPVIHDGGAVQTINTTIANDLVITSTWSAAAAANTVTMYGFTAERVS